jgi:hypothetical protein
MSSVLRLDDFSFSLGSAAELERACAMPAMQVFSERVVDFLDSVSKLTRILPESRSYPELAAFAFWCRRASIESMRTGYSKEFFWGRGFALHFSPGNVPLNFAYSLAVGLLSGNANAIRLSGRHFPQEVLLCRTLENLLSTEYTDLRPYAVCFRCDHDDPALPVLSGNCAVRVIWGGNETVTKLRQLPLVPRAVELNFADRYSLCVIDSDAWLSAENREGLAERFFHDAYWSNQLGCTSPRAVLWLGDGAAEARADFWTRGSAAARDYPMPDIMAVKKREAALALATFCDGARLVNTNNLAVRVEVPNLRPEYMTLCPGGGFFLESTAKSLDALYCAAGSRCQTITSFGVEKSAFETFFKTYGPLGIDRVVPLGRSMDFSLNWDGYDLIRSMSRSITLNPEI